MWDIILDAYAPMASLIADEGMKGDEEEPFFDGKRFIKPVQAAETLRMSDMIYLF